MFRNIFSRFFKPKPTLNKYIDDQLNKGESKKDLETRLLKDLEEGGPIFSDFKDAIKVTPNGIIKDFKPNPYPEDGILTFKWTCCFIPAYPTCDKCLARQGQVKSMEEWEKEGLPQSNKVCGKKCKCMLLPGNF